MASPVGVSDLLSLATAARDIYRYWKGAPDDLKDLLKKFDHVANQLELLNAVITSSGWAPYDKSAELQSLFKRAKAFFVRHDALLRQAASGAAKAGKLARLKFDEDEMQGIKKEVEEQMGMMQEFKTNVVFLASVSRLQGSRTSLQRQSRRPPTAGLNPVNANATQPEAVGRRQQLILEARTDSDVISVISEATTALQFANKLKRRVLGRFEPELETVIATSPEFIALPSSTDRELIENFIVESERVVEKLQLYTLEAAPAKHIDDLAELVAKANKLTRDLRPSKAGISAEVRSLHLPTIEPSPHSFSDSFLGSPTFQKWASTSTDGLQPPIPVPVQHQPSLVLGQPARSISKSASTQTDSDNVFSIRSLSLSESEVGGPAKEHVDLKGWVQVFAGRQTDSQNIKCGLDITRSEGSICVLAVATSRRRKMSVAQTSITPAAMTPGRLMHGRQTDIVTDREGSFRTFQHSFTNTPRPVPHVLHPSAEGPSVGENYSITFHTLQYFVEEGCPPKWTGDLKYTFADVNDRNLLRSKIFGKKLLGTAGTEKINFSYITCTQQALTLWEEESTQVKTITFYRDPPTNKSYPPADVEYRILGITDLRKAAKDGEPLSLNVQQIGKDPTPVAIANRRSSGMTMSSKSSKTRSRDEMSVSIYFSEPLDKQAFVRILKPRSLS